MSTSRSYHRSNSHGSMSGKSEQKPVLFDSKTLQGMLGLNPPVGKKAKTKADRKAQRSAMQSQNREYNRMVESILLEETGQVVKSKKRKKKNSKMSSALFQSAVRGEDKSFVSHLPIEEKESVISYSGVLGSLRNDMSFLDQKYDNIKFQTNLIMSKLQHGYETIIQRDDNMMTVEDAVVLLSYAEVEMDSVVFDAGISKSLADSANGGDDDGPTPSIYNENDMKMKDISTTELEQNSIANDAPTSGPQDMITTDTMPTVTIYFDIWLVHTVSAVRLRLTQDALAIERGVAIPSNSVVGSYQSPTTMRDEARVTDAPGDNSLGFEVLEKELQQGLESAYSQSLANFNFSTVENGNPTGMLRSKSQPEPQSQSISGDTERLAPLRLKKLRKQEAMNETKAMGNFDRGFGRETPRCLRPGESQHESTSSVSAIEELRRELMVANEGLQHLDSMVAENIQWVHANCDVQGVLEKKGHTLSHRAVAQCREMAAERLTDVLESYVLVALRGAFGRLKQAVKLTAIANTSKNYVRGKCIEITVNTLSVALRRQYRKMFQPWVLRVRWETRWEQEAATVEIQRIVRAFLAKCRVFRIICGLKSVIIQCCIRIFLAKCRVCHAKHARQVHRAATALKYFVRSRVVIKLAKAKVQARREERAALKIQSVFRGYQSRKRVRAIRAHIALRHFSACTIQKIYRSKIQCYYNVLERKKYLENQRVEAEREAMRVAALREDAATKIQAQVRRIIAVKRVATKRHERMLNNNARILQRYFQLRVATRFDRDNIKIRRERHYAAIKIQSICRMRLGKKKMDRRRDDHARGIPLQSDPSYDEDDPDVIAAAIKIQSVVRGDQARQKATDKKRNKKKSRLRLKGRDKRKSDTEDPPPKSVSRGFSMKKLLSRTSFDSKPKTESKSNPPSRRQSAENSSRKFNDEDSGRQSSSARRSFSPNSDKSRPSSPQDSKSQSRPSSAQKSKPTSRPNSGRVSRPVSGQKSKSPSRPTSGASFRGMLSRGLSSFRGGNDVDEEDKDEEKSFSKSGPTSERRATSAHSTPSSSRNNSAKKREKSKSFSGGDIKKPIPLQPKTPSRPIDEIEMTRNEEGQSEMKDDDVTHNSGEISRPTSGKSSVKNDDHDSGRVSRPASGKSSKPSSQPSSRPTSAGIKPTSARSRLTSPITSTPTPTLNESNSTVDIPLSDVDEQHLEEDKQLAQMEIGGSLEDVKEVANEDEDEKVTVDEKAEQEKDETEIDKELKVEEKSDDKNKNDDSVPKPTEEEESRGRPLSRKDSKRAQSPGLLRQASKIFGRSMSLPEKRDSSQSPTRAQAPLRKLSSMLSFRGTPSKKKRPKSVYKPKNRTLIPRSNNEAAIRIQSIVRQRLGYKKAKAKKKEVRNLQKKAGLIVLWAIVTIQRVIRGRIGRWRWTRIQKEYRDKLRKEENDRIWKELEEEEERERKEAAEKQRLADELEEKNNAMWSQYGKPKPKHENDTSVSATTDPRDRVIPPPATEPPPLHSTGPLQSNAGISELEDRMRRLEEMEKTMIEKEERMIEAAKKAEEKAAEMQKAIEAMEKRAAEEEAEKQVRRSMMELAAGPMSSMGSQLSTGPVRSSRPSARNGPMASSRSKGPNSSRPPPSARSAKDGTPRPKEVLKVHVQGVEWCQLWDPDESAWYWYCESTGAAQWDQPSEHGYESAGAMTDYSTENDGWNTESGSQWQEYWDEQAQAKYWYNTSTGEASWTPPESDAGSVGGGSFQGPGDDWVSYIDDTTGEEYWYNTKTGETSWSM